VAGDVLVEHDPQEPLARDEHPAGTCRRTIPTQRSANACRPRTLGGIFTAVMPAWARTASKEPVNWSARNDRYGWKTTDRPGSDTQGLTSATRFHTADHLGMQEYETAAAASVPIGQGPRRADEPVGRHSECATLIQTIAAVRAGESRSLVIGGEPGVGKSALLQYLADRAAGCRVVRVAGIQSEMELPFSAIHQLCRPMLGGLDRLPGPQGEALATAFGLRSGPVPDRFLIGLAVLGLLAESAEDRPLICLVDDAQWLDRASAQILAFVARRLYAESVACVFAVRAGGAEELDGLPQLLLGRLTDRDSRTLLRSVVPGRLDESVGERIVSEARGNPLALLELTRGLSQPRLAGGFGLPAADGVPDRIEDAFRRRWAALPADAGLLVLLAAADPVGDPVLVWRAAKALGIDAQAAAPAEAADLCEFGTGVWFRHPLVRSAVYGAASAVDRRRVHQALAEATDEQADPDRRAWHRAHAAAGPDEDVAAELERSADRARARGGLAAAAAFLETAAMLSPDPGRRAHRALQASQAKHLAGAPDAALTLLVAAEAGPLTQWQRAQADLLRGQIAFTTNRGNDAPPLLLAAAHRFTPVDVRLARETYLEALAAALFAGQLAQHGSALEVARAARAAPPPQQPHCATDLLLEGLTALITDGYVHGAPTLRRALAAFRAEETGRQEGLRWFWLACHTAALLWDHDSWDVLSDRFVRLARKAGALTVLPIALTSRAGMHLFAGDFAAAESLLDELSAIAGATGLQNPPYGAVALAAVRGQENEALELRSAAIQGVIERGEGLGLPFVDCLTAILHNGLSGYEQAFTAAEQADRQPQCLWFSTLGSAELVEAAVRHGIPDQSADALVRLSAATYASGSDWGLGTAACAQALLSEGASAEPLYREAIERLARTPVRLTLARAHLLYGEWLRRERRRLDAREQLRTAHAMFTTMGADAFARRAARELHATGETARRRTVETGSQLTAQEAQVARLAMEGLTNSAIGGRLYLSPRTVEYHMRKVLAKLDITSRSQLKHALSGNRLRGAG
jgi:DNA-binding CsgD family transcriptional regulator